ncbi:MAG: hypothetical protein AAGA80_12925 [Cyanobacteria bacterium P01_F01_bin.143]
MQITTIEPLIAKILPQAVVTHKTEDVWQIEHQEMKILVVLSEDQSWLRILTAIAPIQEVQPLLMPILEANFETTGEIRYALAENVLWAVFHHRLGSLIEDDFCHAISSLVSLAEQGLSGLFKQLMEKRILAIIKASKLQGQTKTSTYQTLERFYQEGMLGGMEQTSEERAKFLSAWKYQLDRLWDEKIEN